MKVLGVSVPLCLDGSEQRLTDTLSDQVSARIEPLAVPIRFGIREWIGSAAVAEVSILIDIDQCDFRPSVESIFAFRRAENRRADRFDIAFLVPTGLGAAIGGHSGDATPAARLLASCCDTLITHPNVANAADINELPQEVLYVEGSVLTRMLMGWVQLRPVRSNRLIAIIDSKGHPFFVDQAINAVNALRSVRGAYCDKVIVTDSLPDLKVCFGETGTAGGEVSELETLLRILELECADADAVAISSVVQCPVEYQKAYLIQTNPGVNPWGGIEAMLTHAIGQFTSLPVAHSPLFRQEDIAGFQYGVVDPRIAAEAMSMTGFYSVLKGLAFAPKIENMLIGQTASSAVSAETIGCVVTPESCVGLPTIAACLQGIPTIAVQENVTVMRATLAQLPWRRGQLYRVNNYWEAAGVALALKQGLDPDSCRRPLESAMVLRDSDRGAKIDTEVQQAPHIAK